jgi:hypothetical protein
MPLVRLFIAWRIRCEKISASNGAGAGKGQAAIARGLVIKKRLADYASRTPSTNAFSLREREG